MFRCARIATILFLTLPLAPFDAWCASWGDVGVAYYEKIANTKGFYVVDGVRVKLTRDDGDAFDAPHQGLAGNEGPGVGGSGE